MFFILFKEENGSSHKELRTNFVCQSGMWYRKWSDCFYDWKTSFPTSFNLVFGGVGPARPCWLFLFLTPDIALGTPLTLETSAWEACASTWKCTAGTSQPLFQREHVLFLHHNRPVHSHTALAELAEAQVIWRLFKALLKCVVTLKFYIGHHYMLIITFLLEVWNSSDSNQKSCGEHLAKYCQSD